MSSETLSKNNDSANPWENFSMREMPTTSPDLTCRLLIKEVYRLGSMGKIAHFIDEKLMVEPKDYDSVGEFHSDNPGYSEMLDEQLGADEKAALKEYSGYRFAWINSFARGFWDYEKMGEVTPEKEKQIEESIALIGGAFQKSVELSEDLLTFRGTNLDGFRQYGISSISDLSKLKGQFYLESGFTSTAMVRENSFAGKHGSGLWLGDSDIEIDYHIPANFKEVIPLLNHDLSYNPEQTEVLINRFALGYVSDVEVKDGRARVSVLLIPRNVYEEDSGATEN